MTSAHIATSKILRHSNDNSLPLWILSHSLSRWRLQINTNTNENKCSMVDIFFSLLFFVFVSREKKSFLLSVSLLYRLGCVGIHLIRHTWSYVKYKNNMCAQPNVYSYIFETLANIWIFYNKFKHIGMSGGGVGGACLIEPQRHDTFFVLSKYATIFIF